MNANSIQIKNIPDTLFMKFRKKAREVKGDKKGSYREAMIEAMEMWIENVIE